MTWNMLLKIFVCWSCEVSKREAGQRLAVADIPPGIDDFLRHVLGRKADVAAAFGEEQLVTDRHLHSPASKKLHSTHSLHRQRTTPYTRYIAHCTLRATRTVHATPHISSAPARQWCWHVASWGVRVRVSATMRRRRCWS